MRQEHIIQFLKLLGVPEKQIEVARGWVNSPCIFAQWTHESGIDEHPSFGIFINDVGESYYYCFGCCPSGRNLSWVLHNLWLHTNNYPYEAASFFAKHEIFTESPKQIDDACAYVYDVWENNESPFEEAKVLPQKVLNKYPLLYGAKDRKSSACLSYFTEERNVSISSVYESKVRYDPEGATVIYPMTDKEGGVYLLRARSIYRKKMWTISPKVAGFSDLKFSSLKISGALFGLDSINWAKPVMLVEGAEDRLRLLTLGYSNVVASLTTNFTHAQINNLLTAPALIIGYDNDKAGDDNFFKILMKYKQVIPIFRINWGAAGVTSNTGKPIKDAGDLENKEQLLKVLTQMEVYT